MREAQEGSYTVARNSPKSYSTSGNVCSVSHVSRRLDRTMLFRQPDVIARITAVVVEQLAWNIKRPTQTAASRTIHGASVGPKWANDYRCRAQSLFRYHPRKVNEFSLAFGRNCSQMFPRSSTSHAISAPVRPERMCIRTNLQRWAHHPCIEDRSDTNTAGDSSPPRSR